MSERLPNSAFSKTNPKLQLFWDSTSLGALKTCARYYEYAIIEGWEPKGARSVHLDFGIWMHSTRERYYHARADGKSHREALLIAVEYVLKATWDKKLKRGWISDDPNKNRKTLLRSIVWYLERWKDDPFETIILDNGKPAVELSFRFALGITTASGEPYLLCGHLDRVGKFAEQIYLSDLKTTKHTLNPDYFQQYSPDNQMSTYSYAAKVVWKLPVAGLIIDAVQVAVGFTRFARGPVQRNDSQLDEWYEDLKLWLAQAEMYAKLDRWPMNDKACFRCDFRSICSKPPSARQRWLESDFKRRVWDPLITRGEI